MRYLCCTWIKYYFNFSQFWFMNLTLYCMILTRKKTTPWAIYCISAWVFIDAKRWKNLGYANSPLIFHSNHIIEHIYSIWKEEFVKINRMNNDWFQVSFLGAPFSILLFFHGVETLTWFCGWISVWCLHCHSHNQSWNLKQKTASIGFIGSMS